MKDKQAQTMLPNRIPWIDICRGIGIILVMYGHVFTSDDQRYFIYSFHMPLFFFLSGLVFKPALDKPLKAILTKNFKQLMIPYLIFAFSTYLFAQVTNPTRDMTPGGIAWQLFGIFYGSGTNGMLGFNVLLWFLPCLFITKLSFAFLTRKVTDARIIGLLLLVSGVFGYDFSLILPQIKLPFGFEIALTSIVFFGLGYLWKIRKVVFTASRISLLLYAAIGIGITYLTATQNFHIDHYQIDLRTNRLGNFFLFYGSALSGIFSTILVSQLIAKNKVLEYIGSHSMVIFAWHYLLFVNMRVITDMLVSDDFINSVKLILPTFYVAAATVIILLSQKIILKLKTVSHFLPFTQ